MADRRFPHLLQALDDEEHLDRLDRLTRGEAQPEEPDAALTDASPRIQTLHQLSAAPDPAFQARLADLLLSTPATTPESRPAPTTASLPAPATAATPGLATVTPLHPRVKPVPKPSGQAAWTLISGLALAAAVGIVVLPRLFPDETLPTMALDVHVREAQMMGAPSSPSEPVLRAPRAGCLELSLRPSHRYHGAISTQLALIPQGRNGTVLPWPARMLPRDGGTLRSEGTCVPLPPAAGPGRWRIAVAYGTQLPDEATFFQLAQSENPAPPSTSKQTWQIARQPLEITE